VHIGPLSRASQSVDNVLGWPGLRVSPSEIDEQLATGRGGSDAREKTAEVLVRKTVEPGRGTSHSRDRTLRRDTGRVPKRAVRGHP
jgi:hypothetical protein